MHFSSQNRVIFPRIVSIWLFVVFFIGKVIGQEASDSLPIMQTNKGLIYSLPQAIQGQVPGLLVSRPGANPNASFDMIYRGFHTFSQRMQPLLMLDGMPGLDWQLLDPFLIGQIKTRTGSSLSQLGLQANAGVFDANVDWALKKGFSIELDQSLSIETYQRPYDVLSVNEFLQKAPEGTFFGGSATNWMDAFMRTGISNHTGLKIGHQGGNHTSRFAVSHRDLNGIQRKTGFGQLSLYGAHDQEFGQGKLKLGASAFWTKRAADVGNSDFFQAAYSMNPTVGLNQPINYFTFFFGNPYERFQLDRNTYEGHMWMYQVNVEAKPVQNLTLKGRLGKVGQGHEQMLFNGVNAASGLGTIQIQRKFIESRTYMDLVAEYLYTKGKWNLSPSLRWMDQTFDYERSVITQIGVSTPSPGIIAQSDPADGGKYRMMSLGGGFHAAWNEKINFRLNFQAETSANLGSMVGWGKFWGADLAYKLHPRLKFFTAFSRTGLAPQQAGLSRTIIDIGETAVVRHQANPDLRWESMVQGEFGFVLDLLKDRLNFKGTFYGNRAKDFIYLLPNFDISQPDPNGAFPMAYQNFGAIQNRGLEWELFFQTKKSGDWRYATRINASFLHSQWQDLKSRYVNLEGRDMGFSRFVGSNLQQYNVLSTKDRIGTVRALNYLGVDMRAGGVWVFDAPRTGSDWRENYVPQGTAIPKWWMGWSHQVSYKKWTADIFFRGVFGHVNAQEALLRYGGVQFFNNNVIRSSFEELQDLGLRQTNEFSNYFIANSGFLSLHHMGISRNLDLTIGQKKMVATLGLVGNNLLYLTSYSGPDPEARLNSTMFWQMDYLVGRTNNYFAPGIDAASTWLPGRAISLQVQLRY